MTPSTCPHCGARGVKIADRLTKDGLTIVADYCGKCGKNWPKQSEKPPDLVTDGIGRVLKMPEPQR